MEEKIETFTYTYSAKQQEEVKRIREKYVPREEDKFEELRRLDASVEQAGLVPALSLGISGTLLLGIGLCCVLVWTRLFALGVVIGVIGIVGIAAAYPVNRLLVKRRREEIAPQVLQLTEALLKE